MENQVLISEEMPYEKFEKYGLEALTNSDLLAILLRTGTKEMNVKQLAQYLLAYSTKGQKSSLISLYEFSYEQLQGIKGIGKIKALQIMSLLELSKRIAKERHEPNTKISSPRILSQYFMEALRHEQKECFIVTFLDAKCKMIGYKMISTGSLTASVVHPREVYKIAIQKSAYSIIVLHNHPSGDPSPSKEDIQITERLKKVGELIGIPLLDHIIIGDGIYKSLKEESYL
ncbi:MAG: DNA repair protein RadC [Candidatus Cellulosilyticum pullistercoris]|uniref:DNA repair protein RadC n=1 Tax=Candidatus Cellulosilyticum pullistercoris TaxID=2838521 RepID=A0A9E2NJL1_9FIRM|nr:DNA repair protein RadC [Candidatus Cellulosilyticum pullistercoris]